MSGRVEVGSTLCDRRLIEPHAGKPPDQIVPAIAARHPFVPPGRQVDLSAGVNKFFGNLGAGRSGSHYQHRSWWNLTGRLVAAGMNLEQVMSVDR